MRILFEAESAEAALKHGYPNALKYAPEMHGKVLRGRVMPAALIDPEHHSCDRAKYADMLLRVVETILGWNGFSRFNP